HRRGQLLLMSPLNWYTKDHRWGLAPGYRKDDVRRFDRRVQEDCLACHSGRPITIAPGSNRFPEPAFLEMAIGCERCHGPGKAHIDRHRAASPPDAGTDPIVNPAKLPADRREAVCYQCHLAAAARILRPGKDHAGFVPGMRLSDVWAVLDAGAELTEDGRTKLVNHVQQLRESHCFLNSNGTLGCVSCHDPHRVPSPDKRSDFYRTRCIACHDSQPCTADQTDRAHVGDACTDCHMPRRNTTATAHAAQTDHRILRNPAETDAADTDRGPTTLRFFDNMDRDLDPPERDRAAALGTLMYLSQKGRRIPADLVQTLYSLVPKFPRDKLLLNATGDAARKLGNDRAAEDCFQRVLQIDPENENALYGMAHLHYQQQRMSDVIAETEKLTAIDPGDVSILTIRADALNRLGKTDQAIACLRQALTANPGLVELRRYLADTCRRTGRSEEAAQQEELIRRLTSAASDKARSRPETATSR
ncbi:MAG: tetratricopeptide repeat protein, partial [Planctomycetaceae bacterium]|nr:tetratricopeptide repeat protein [Planctomycetaceae bacterium]